MSKVRIYDLSKALGVSNKQLMDFVEQTFNVSLKSHSSSIDQHMADKAAERFKGKGYVAVAEKPATDKSLPENELMAPKSYKKEDLFKKASPAKPEAPGQKPTPPQPARPAQALNQNTNAPVQPSAAADKSASASAQPGAGSPVITKTPLIQRPMAPGSFGNQAPRTQSSNAGARPGYGGYGRERGGWQPPPPPRFEGAARDNRRDAGRPKQDNAQPNTPPRAIPTGAVRRPGERVETPPSAPAASAAQAQPAGARPVTIRPTDVPRQPSIHGTGTGRPAQSAPGQAYDPSPARRDRPARPAGSAPMGGPGTSAPSGFPPSPGSPSAGRPRGGKGKQDAREKAREQEREREARIAERKAANEAKLPTPENPVFVSIDESMTVTALADLLGIKTTDIIRQLFLKGVMVTVNQSLDVPTARGIATQLGYTVEASKE
ncbi:MAG: translation initiation factor IF-2 N-terminal domain-containing protein, partial [Vampirovibrionales bacterium]|nr:translation initiation factor IF-2 N-terminal domain-containing protein [Vampirovibrionales bacterium]